MSRANSSDRNMTNSAMPSRQPLIFLAAALFMFSFVGCGRGPDMVTIYGTVTRGGQPVPDLVLNFIPENGRPSWGYTDDEGYYELHYNRDRDGAVLGKHRVFISFLPRDPKVQFAMTEGRLKYPSGIPEILDKYGNPDTSPLEFDLSQSQQVDLALD